MDFRLTSSVMIENGSIPTKYTCKGENISPPLQWENPPKGTQGFVLIVEDPDAPHKTLDHWIMYNIPASTFEIKEGMVPPDTLQGVNHHGKSAYTGPCPPSGTHRYFFKLYAIDQMLDVPSGASKQEVEQAMQSHILGKTQLMGTYSSNR